MRADRIAIVAACQFGGMPALHAEQQDRGLSIRRRAVTGPLDAALRALPMLPVPDARPHAIVRPASPPSTGLLQSWTIAGAELGVGRYAVGTVARPRTNMERERMMERENRNIAGAGLRLRF